MTISGFAAYVKQLWKNKPDTSTPLSAERLTHMEGGIKGNSDAIEKLAAAVVSQIANDPDKIASMAALYAVNEYAKSVNKRVDDTNSNLFEILTEGNITIAQYKNASVVSTVSNCLAFYSKKIVRLEFGLVLLAQHLGEENTTIFTLPENIRPSFLSYFNLASTDGTYTAKCHIDLNGNIIISKMPSTAKYIGGQAHYWK